MQQPNNINILTIKTQKYVHWDKMFLEQNQKYKNWICHRIN
uniref:Uncharacterized protein n=1 Tax=Meloidogyne enterolobii TaxID=390850 RepID=A0A6V7WT44_MELEN|nr:unnamed protein product [Meloidogyne enterolobii]